MIEYRKLDIWKRGIEILKQVYKVSAKFPDEEKFGLTSQIRRAVVSILSNIAEGAGRSSNAQFVNFLSFSKGSAFEVEGQMVVAYEFNYISEDELSQILKEIDHYSRMNQRLQNYFKNQKK